ncbi:MAG: 3-hydroxyacyl-ACP dehydratase FabZ [Candidatus Omnitrophica bacterium]|nr:3-hydroxyacyl-ACP dehydratase FabZ [Candidatus Omnitrophota bacterium]
MLNAEDIKGLIPQRPPFLMLDRVIELKEGESIKAYKNVTMNEDYFRGHFPDMPILPGALMIEAMAQAALVLFKKSMPDLTATIFYLANVKVRFLKPVVPGDQLVIIAKIVKAARIGGICEVEASVNNETAAKGEMTFAGK